MAESTVAIVGLGLIGGSLARDLAARRMRVLGYDDDPDTLSRALAAGAVHQSIPATMEGLEGAGLLVIATPVTAALRVLETALPHLGEHTVVTDVASTKRSIQAAAASLGLAHRYIGAHPLAGDHRAGWDASRAGLFAGARVILCPTDETDARSLAAADQLWRQVGATTVAMDAEDHDRLLALTSHLPQLLAYALAGALADAGVDRQWLGPGGRDTLRLAASPPALWAGISLDNADRVLDALSAVQERITELVDAIERQDQAALVRLLDSGRRWFSAD